jgi:hypothetical protein
MQTRAVRIRDCNQQRRLVVDRGGQPPGTTLVTTAACQLAN